jgi:regulator of RNase E activity RraA
MARFEWSAEEQSRLEALRESLAEVSTATAHHLVQQLGWRNTYALGLKPLQELGLGRRIVGRARTLRYLMRREPERVPQDELERQGARERRRVSPEIVLIESLEPGDVFCVDALGVMTSGIIGDILSTRIHTRGAHAAVVHGVVRDAPFIRQVGLPVFSHGSHPSAVTRDLQPVDFDVPINLSGVHVRPGDVILADDEGVLALPLELAEYVADKGPEKELLELWIREKIAGGGSVHEYYPPLPEKLDEYTRETGRTLKHRYG